MYLDKGVFKDRKELIFLGIAMAMFIISCILISDKKYFWNDELYSWYFLADSSLGHMLRAFHDRINNTPVLYFLLGWLWAKIFGASELSLRLFSSFGVCIACLVTWLTLRRNYRFWPTTIGTFIVFCTSDMVLSQNAEARMYGLFIAIAALATLQFDAINRQLRLSAKDYSLLIGLHIALVHTHLFGGFYSGVFCLSFLIRDLLSKKFRYRLYGAFLLAWASIVFYIPSFLIQSEAGHPRAWVPIPILQDLKNFILLANGSILDLKYIAILFFMLVFLSILMFQESIASIEKPSSHKSSEWSLLILSLLLILVPIFIWILSRTVKPIFWDRYMLPSILGYSILITHFLDQLPIFQVKQRAQRPQATLLQHIRTILFPILLLSFMAVLLLNPILYAKQYVSGRPFPGEEDNIYGYEDLPIVVQTSGGFLERMHYSPNRERYYYILDRETAELDESGQFVLQEYKHLDAYKRNYPELLGDNILTSDDFLQKFDQFLVLDHNFDKTCPTMAVGLSNAINWKNLQCPQWVEVRFLGNPDYQVRELGDVHGWFTLLHVSNRS